MFYVFFEAILDKKFIFNVPTSNEEFNRLAEKMFPYWSNKNNNSKISSFMKDLDPEKVYTHQEYIKYLEIKGITDKNHLTYYKSKGGSKGFGTIIQETSEGFKLYSQLLNAYQKNFN